MNIALIDGTSVTKVGDYRSIFPQTSFGPNGPSDEFLAENNAKRVNVFLPYDASTQKLVACDPYIDGEWVYTVEVEPLTPEDQQARIDSQWANVRADRNSRLAACDWTQLPDAPGDKAAWAIYRQELRDVTSQADPFAIVWPVAPDSIITSNDDEI
jgi:hypothetical protein